MFIKKTKPLRAELYKPRRYNLIISSSKHTNFLPGSYSCSCSEDFELSGDGYKCTPLGICAQNPCHNKGRCVIDEHSFHCECEKGFTGRLCHNKVQLELPDFLNIETDSQTGFFKSLGVYGVIQSESVIVVAILIPV